MEDCPTTAIALILPDPARGFDLGRTAGDLDGALRSRAPASYRMTLSDATATFDLGETRILLARTRWGAAEGSDCLAIAVGATTAAPPDAARAARLGALCRGIAAQVTARHGAAATLRFGCDRPVSAALIDEVLAGLDRGALPPGVFYLPSDDAALTADRRQMGKVRGALYHADHPADRAGITPQMRLAVQSMNATLIMVSLPLGAALMTYSLLRGENLRLTARAMAMTGTILGLLHTPLAQTLAHRMF